MAGDIQQQPRWDNQVVIVMVIISSKLVVRDSQR
jgi:hypothetical protein